MGNMWSEGLISPNGSVMRYSLYGTLSKIKQEKKLHEQNEAITKKLISHSESNNNDRSRASNITLSNKSAMYRKSGRKREKELTPDVEAMLSTFKL